MTPSKNKRTNNSSVNENSISNNDNNNNNKHDNDHCKNDDKNDKTAETTPDAKATMRQYPLELLHPIVCKQQEGTDEFERL